MRFVLASESVRRVDLLRAAGYSFEARHSGFPEVTLASPRETAETNARGKALAVARPGTTAETFHTSSQARLGENFQLLSHTAGHGTRYPQRPRLRQRPRRLAPRPARQRLRRPSAMAVVLLAVPVLI